jgi:hypothetical protein
VILRGAVVFGLNDQVTRWIADRIPDFVISPDTVSLAVYKGGRTVAGVAFYGFNGAHAYAAIAADDVGAPWADRATLRTLFGHAFQGMGCQALTVTVPSSNPASVNLAVKLGFEPEALVKFAAHDASTLIVLKMYREQCKWIEHGLPEG